MWGCIVRGGRAKRAERSRIGDHAWVSDHASHWQERAPRQRCRRGADVVLAWSPTWRRRGAGVALAWHWRGTGVGLAWWWRGGGVVLTWWWRGADVVLTGMRTVPTRPRSLYRTKRQVKDSARVKNVCGRASLVSSTYPHASRAPQSGTLYVQTSKRNRNSKTTATHPFENDRRPRSIARTNSSPVSNSST